MYKFNDIEHMHSLDDKPLLGTSTVVGVIAKPLTYWAAGKAVGHLGWTNSKVMVDGKYKTVAMAERCAIALPHLEKIKRMEVSEFVVLLDEGYKAHATSLKESSVGGTDLHAKLEEYVKMCISNNEIIADKAVFHPQIHPFIDWSVKNVKRFLWSEGHCYSKELWVGGISDAGFEDKDGRYAIIDFKSSKEAYISQFVQIAGYDLQISENGVLSDKGELLFKLDKPINYYCVLPFGAQNPEPVIHENTEEAKEGFKAAVTLYKLVNFTKTS